MPQSFSKRNISDAENRLRLLFCVDVLGMLTREQLWPFVARLDLMEYVPMCLYVDELVRDGALVMGAHAAEGVLCLTDKGQSTLRMFQNRMPQTDRRLIAAAAPAYATTLRERRQMSAVHELAPEGFYQVACAVREGDLPTLFLRVTTRRRALTAGAVKRFRQCASRILTMLFSLPVPHGSTAARPETVAELEEALRLVAPDRPVIADFSPHEQAAVVCLRQRDAVIRLALLLPSKDAAIGWSAAALDQPEALAARVIALLMGKEEGP